MLALLVPGDAFAQTAMVTLRSLDSGQTQVVQFNPRELKLTKHVPWEKHKSSQGDSPTLEFTSADPKTLDFELSFDTFEDQTDVRDVYVGKLENLALIDPGLKRPPLVQVEWGGFGTFRGVISNLSVRYTLFLPDGTPVRATAAVTVTEAARVRGGKASSTPVQTCVSQQDCTLPEMCFSGACAPPP
jgi:hypothetical protein